MADKDTNDFIQALTGSLSGETFHKLTLSKPGPKADGLVSASARLVDLRSQSFFSLTIKKARTEEVTNYRTSEVATALRPLLGPVFKQADLFTSEGSWHLLFSKKGEAKLLMKSTVATKAPPRSHDKEKLKRLDLSLKPWPRDLGLLNMKDKIHQIEKFLEIVEGTMESWAPGKSGGAGKLRILDLGAGKGYLSFALYQWLTLVKGWEVELEAVEIQKHLVEQGNLAAAASGFSGLKFIHFRIDEISPKPRDMVVVLHACDTATDDALALGIRSGARLIFAAPCCHQELRTQISKKGGLEGVLKFGILLERQAEILSDGLRALVLESMGYKTKVMEFVPAEHSGKNLLILAELTETPDPAKSIQIKTLKQQFGLERVYLQSLLDLEELSDLSPPWRKLGVVARETMTTKD